MSNPPNSVPNRLILRQPDDWHVHVRDGAVLESVLAYTTRQFARAIIMPNLAQPITTVALAAAYRERIQAAIPEGSAFKPLMTCYLTDEMAPDEVERGFASGLFAACKLYPAGATTNSSHGVTDIAKIYPVLETMQRIGMPLLVHGEVTDTAIDIFDREAVFIDRILSKLIVDFPALKLVFEHITTAEAVDFVTDSGQQIAATITPHHLDCNRNAMFQGGMRPDFYCLPILKRETHRTALRKAATSGSAKFFLGTDSAPHTRDKKETACGCAGIFNAPYALESYAKTFDEEGALDKLEAFASENGPKFYGLELNKARVVLERKPFSVPSLLGDGALQLAPFHAGNRLAWRFMGLEKP